MNDSFKKACILYIKGTNKDAFEEFINELMLHQYGSDNYIPIRPTKDKGSDGVIKCTSTILACYGPENYSLQSFKNKVLGTKSVKGDFPKYQIEWEDTYDNWTMFVNHNISPDQLKLIDSLPIKKGKATIKGIDSIIYIIEHELSPIKQRKLSFFMGLDYLYKLDTIKEIIKSLLHNAPNTNNNIEYSLPPLYIDEKIRLNYSDDDIDGISTEYSLYATDIFDIISNILSEYDSDEITAFKMRIIKDFNGFDGNFKTKFNKQTDMYSKLYGEDDDETIRYIRAILFYLFEQCFIGKKTPEEC